MSGFDFSLFTQGGPMLVVLVLMAAVVIVLFIERTLYLHRGQIRSKPFLDGIEKHARTPPAGRGGHPLRRNPGPGRCGGEGRAC
ncbi:MAG: hypothetical protein QM760_01695 [Nibricoccus sp.]